MGLTAGSKYAILKSSRWIMSPRPCREGFAVNPKLEEVNVMASPNLIKKALSSATAAQLIRVRAILGRHSGEHGYDVWQGKIKDALKAFDAGQYDHPEVAFLLPDKDLGETLR